MDSDIIDLAFNRDFEFNIETENTMNSSSETIQFMINQQNSEKWKSDKLSSTIIKIIKKHEQINEQMQRTSTADVLAGIKFNSEKHNTSAAKAERYSKSKAAKEVENRNSADTDFIYILENIPPHPHLTAGENEITNALFEDIKQYDSIWKDTVVRYNNPFDPHLSFGGLVTNVRTKGVNNRNKEVPLRYTDTLNYFLNIKNPSVFANKYINKYQQYLSGLRRDPLALADNQLSSTNREKSNKLLDDIDELETMFKTNLDKVYRAPPFVGNKLEDMDMWSQIYATKRFWSEEESENFLSNKNSTNIGMCSSLFSDTMERQEYLFSDIMERNECQQSTLSPRADSGQTNVNHIRDITSDKATPSEYGHVGLDAKIEVSNGNETPWSAKGDEYSNRSQITPQTTMFWYHQQRRQREVQQQRQYSQQQQLCDMRNQQNNGNYEHHPVSHVQQPRANQQDCNVQKNGQKQFTVPDTDQQQFPSDQQRNITTCQNNQYVNKHKGHFKTQDDTHPTHIPPPIVTSGVMNHGPKNGDTLSTPRIPEQTDVGHQTGCVSNSYNCRQPQQSTKYIQPTRYYADAVEYGNVNLQNRTFVQQTKPPGNDIKYDDEVWYFNGVPHQYARRSIRVEAKHPVVNTANHTDGANNINRNVSGGINMQAPTMPPCVPQVHQDPRLNKTRYNSSMNGIAAQSNLHSDQRNAYWPYNINNNKEQNGTYREYMNIAKYSDTLSESSLSSYGMSETSSEYSTESSSSGMSIHCQDESDTGEDADTLPLLCHEELYAFDGESEQLTCEADDNNNQHEHLKDDLLPITRTFSRYDSEPLCYQNTIEQMPGQQISIVWGRTASNRDRLKPLKKPNNLRTLPSNLIKII